MESSWLRDISYGGIGACWKSLKFVHVGIENEFTLKNSFEWSVRTGFQVSLPLSLRRQQFLLQINLLFLQNRPNLLHFVLVSLGWVFYTPSSLVSSAATSSVSSNWGFVSSAASPGKTSCYAIDKLGQLPNQRTKRFSYLGYYRLSTFAWVSVEIQVRLLTVDNYLFHFGWSLCIKNDILNFAGQQSILSRLAYRWSWNQLLLGSNHSGGTA